MSLSGMDTVRNGLARGLARFVAPVRLPDGFAPAFAQKPEGTVFDLAANAAAAEALAHPMLGGGEGATALLLALASGECPPPRAIGPARIVVEDEAPRHFRIATPHHVFTGDLLRGEIRQHFHDQDGPPAATHGGNLVEFDFSGRWHCLDVEDAIVDAGIENTEGGVRLFHESLLRGCSERLLHGEAQDVARLRYVYEVRADTPVLTLTVTLTTLPSVVLDRPQITTACDAMSPGDAAGYATLLLDDAERLSPAGDNTVHHGPISRFGARQERTPSRASTLRITPHGPATPLSVTTNGQAEGRLHWLLTRYAGDPLAPSQTLSLREERLLLRGTDGPIVAPRGADAASAAPRQRIATALATQALLGDPAGAEALTIAARLNLAALPDAEAAPAELAQALMTAGLLFHASRSEEDRARAEAITARLRATQTEEGVFRESGATAHVAEHAVALLALARNLPLFPGSGDAVRRGIDALALISLPGPVDTITLPAAQAAGTEELALLLRALRAAQAARADGTLAMSAAEARRLAFLADLALRLLQARITPEGDALIVDGPLSAQIATLAALVPPEGAVGR